MNNLSKKTLLSIILVFYLFSRTEKMRRGFGPFVRALSNAVSVAATTGLFVLAGGAHQRRGVPGIADFIAARRVVRVGSLEVSDGLPKRAAEGTVQRVLGDDAPLGAVEPGREAAKNIGF
jgi:hypothetical protein